MTNGVGRFLFVAGVASTLYAASCDRNARKGGPPTVAKVTFVVDRMSEGVVEIRNVRGATNPIVTESGFEMHLKLGEKNTYDYKRWPSPNVANGRFDGGEEIAVSWDHGDAKYSLTVDSIDTAGNLRLILKKIR